MKVKPSGGNKKLAIWGGAARRARLPGKSRPEGRSGPGFSGVTGRAAYAARVTKKIAYGVLV